MRVRGQTKKVIHMMIIDLKAEDKDLIGQAAQLLYESFIGISLAWPSLEKALEEVYDSISESGDGQISRVAVDQGAVVGWIGGKSMYDGNVWELHPLVVKESFRGKGIGRALVEDLEKLVAERGALTIWLGTDDENGATSLSDTDLYENLAEKISGIKNLKRHPFEFYQKVGFSIVGVMPDANGIGKPDIYMAKCVARKEQK
jgi:aminoglycoside 6'-N-acetyltransferase I